MPSGYTHPGILQMSSTEKVLLCSEAKLSCLAEAAESQSCHEATEEEISRSQEVSHYSPVYFQRTPGQKASAPTAPSCGENPEYLQGLLAKEVVLPAKTSSCDNPAVLEGLLQWEENQRSLP